MNVKVSLLVVSKESAGNVGRVCLESVDQMGSIANLTILSLLIQE